MAFVIKNSRLQTASSGASLGRAYLEQWVQVSTGARVLPATTTDQIFRVKGGRVLVYLILGQCTTICSGTATNLKVTSKALDAASAAVGTAVDLCSNVAITSKEVGAFYTVEGDGTAGVANNAGAGLPASGVGRCILPQGEIYLTTDATNTGAFKWDIWYQPLDYGAYVESVGTATVAI